MEVILLKKARKDKDYWKRTGNVQIMKRITDLLNDIHAELFCKKEMRKSICPDGQSGWHRACPYLEQQQRYELFQPCHAKFEQAVIMNFLDKHPSENRMEFTKLKVACKYASIGRGCTYS